MERELSYLVICWKFLKNKACRIFRIMFIIKYIFDKILIFQCSLFSRPLTLSTIIRICRLLKISILKVEILILYMKCFFYESPRDKVLSSRRNIRVRWPISPRHIYFCYSLYLWSWNICAPIRFRPRKLTNKLPLSVPWPIRS